METINITVPVSKVDLQQRLVFGWVYASEASDGSVIVDHSGEHIPLADLEKAAYDFMERGMPAGADHEGEPVASVVESIVVTPEKLAAMGVEGTISKYGWFAGVRIHDAATLKRVENGELTMFSIQGFAEAEEVA